MRRFLIILLLLLFVTPAFAQRSNPQTISRIRDGNTPTTFVDVDTDFNLTFATTLNGMYTLSGMYFFDGANMRRWLGAQMNADNVVATTRAPWTANFLFGYDGATWDRLTTTAAGDALLVTHAGLDTLSYNLFSDGANYRRWLGGQANVESEDEADYIPFTQSYLRGYDAASSSWRWLNVVDTHADGLALTLNGVNTASFMYIYNGATMDLALASATGGLVTYTENWPNSFDEANGWNKTQKTSIATLAPAKETTTGIGTAAQTVISSTEVLDWPNVTVYLENDDGADPFTDADFQVSPDNATWISLTWTACDALAAGEACVFQITNHSYRYVRVQVAAADANDVDVDAWLTANPN
jgi:hypothetical protein